METMKLKAYLANIDMTFKDLGELLDCHPKYLSRISRGKIHPSRRLAAEIEKATDGVVRIKASTKLYRTKKAEAKETAVAA